jgi:hypothetical protein
MLGLYLMWRPSARLPAMEGASGSAPLAADAVSVRREPLAMGPLPVPSLQVAGLFAGFLACVPRIDILSERSCS